MQPPNPPPVMRAPWTPSAAAFSSTIMSTSRQLISKSSRMLDVRFVHQLTAEGKIAGGKRVGGAHGAGVLGDDMPAAAVDHRVKQVGMALEFFERHVAERFDAGERRRRGVERLPRSRDGVDCIRRRRARWWTMVFDITSRTFGSIGTSLRSRLRQSMRSA